MYKQLTYYTYFAFGYQQGSSYYLLAFGLILQFESYLLKMSKLLEFIFGVLALIGSCYCQEKNYTDTVKLLKDKISNRTDIFYHSAYQRLAYISDTYGPRMWGSETLQMAIHQLYKQAVSQGFENVRLQTVKNFSKWVRGNQQLILHDPRPEPTSLNLIGLGNSVPGHVKAEAFVVSSFTDLQLNKDKAKGKIIVFNAPWTDYGEAVQYRGYGAAHAAKFGGVAALVRSVTPVSISSVHTGAQYYSDQYPKIPVAAITTQDAEMLARMQARKQKIILELKMQSTLHLYTYSNNLVFQIRGSEKPDEILLMGGHIDSWDTGSQTGANDDGGGFISCFQAMRLFLKNGLRPKRTMRFIAWSGQEWGDNRNGAIAYLRAHKNELKNHIVAFQDDEGSNKLYGFGYSGGQDGQNLVKMILNTYLKELNASSFSDYGQAVDTDPLYQIGIPVMINLVNDTDDFQYYFTYHHSAGDSMSIMDPDLLDSNVVGIAAMFYILADLEKSIPKPKIDYEKLEQFLEKMRK